MFKLLKLSAILCLLTILIIGGLYIYYNKESKDLDKDARAAAPGKFIQLSKGYVHYELSGPENAPLVVLVHGAGSGYYAWDNNFQPLVNAGFKVLRYDLYGRGLSDRPDVKYDLALFTEQLNELTDSLKLSDTFNIVSVSMGAMIAIDEANKNPNKVSKVIFIDPAAIDRGEVNSALKMPIVSDLLMTIYWAPRAVDKQMKEFYKPESVKEYAQKSEEHLKYKGLRRAMHSTWINCGNNMDNELQSMGKKKEQILLIWGKNDPLTSVKSSVKYKKYIPHLEYAEVDNAGHLANYERPEVVNKLIIDFLKR
jgi:pimeloyl-ACP methyl ester carboxylesterase